MFNPKVERHPKNGHILLLTDLLVPLQMEQIVHQLLRGLDKQKNQLELFYNVAGCTSL